MRPNLREHAFDLIVLTPLQVPQRCATSSREYFARRIGHHRNPKFLICRLWSGSCATHKDAQPLIQPKTNQVRWNSPITPLSGEAAASLYLHKPSEPASCGSTTGTDSRRLREMRHVCNDDVGEHRRRQCREERRHQLLLVVGQQSAQDGYHLLELLRGCGPGSRGVRRKRPAADWWLRSLLPVLRLRRLG